MDRLHVRSFLSAHRACQQVLSRTADVCEPSAGRDAASAQAFAVSGKHTSSRCSSAFSYSSGRLMRVVSLRFSQRGLLFIAGFLGADGRNVILWYGCRRWDETSLALLVLTTDSWFPGQTNTPNASVRHRFSKLLYYLFKSTSALKTPTSSDYSGFKNQILIVTPKMLHLHFCLIRRSITTF